MVLWDGRGPTCIIIKIIMTLKSCPGYSQIIIFNKYPVDCFLLLAAPPLSVDEVLQVVIGVNWRTLGRELIEEEVEEWGEEVVIYTNLDRIHDAHESDEARLRAVVEEFLTETDFIKGRPSWRRVVWALYGVDEIDKAQQISSYAEPLQGILEYDLQVLCTIPRPYWRRTWSGYLILVYAVTCNRFLHTIIRVISVLKHSKNILPRKF